MSEMIKEKLILALCLFVAIIIIGSVAIILGWVVGLPFKIALFIMGFGFEFWRQVVLGLFMISMTVLYMIYQVVK